MSTYGKVLGVALVVPMAFGSLVGCKKAQELTEDQIAEAIANQMVSSYHAMSVEIEATGSNGNTINLGMSCTESGTVSWEQFEENGSICYRSTSSDCGFSVGSRSFTVTSDYEVCGFPPAVNTGGDAATVEDLDGKTLYIVGDVTVESANLAPRTCEYDLELQLMDIEASADSFSMSTSFGGTLCRSDFDRSIDLTVSSSFDVE